MSFEIPGPPSFWLGRRRPPTEVEVAVVGGGIVGLSTAWWLTRQGRSSLVLEAGHLAGRASGRNAGFLMTGTPETYLECERHLGPEAAEAFWRLSADNRELLRAELLDPSAKGHVDCQFQPEGSWIAASGEDSGERDELQASAERLRELGFDIEWRQGDDVAEASGSPRIRAALHQPRDGGLDPVLLCRGLADRAVAAGASVRTGVRVRSLEPHPRGVLLVADGGDVLARRVVVALNAYAPALLPELARELQPVRGQMMALGPDPSAAPGTRTMSGVWYLDRGFQYVRELTCGTVLVGGCRLAAEADERGYREHPTATVQGALERFVETTYPHLVDRPVLRRWAGVMANTASGLPVAGEAARVPGVVYAAGMNGHGMSLGFATGRWLARRALDETTGETSDLLLPPARPTGV